MHSVALGDAKYEESDIRSSTVAYCVYSLLPDSALTMVWLYNAQMVPFSDSIPR